MNILLFNLINISKKIGRKKKINMNFENCKSKNFIDTLSYIIKDEYIGISLTKTLGEKLINENIVKKKKKI